MGGVTRSPFTAIIFAFELTHDQNSLLALLVAATVAHLVSVLVLKRSILTEKVARRGFHVMREYAVDPLGGNLRPRGHGHRRLHRRPRPTAGRPLRGAARRLAAAPPAPLSRCSTRTPASSAFCPGRPSSPARTSPAPRRQRRSCFDPWPWPTPTRSCAPWPTAWPHLGLGVLPVVDRARPHPARRAHHPVRPPPGPPEAAGGGAARRAGPHVAPCRRPGSHGPGVGVWLRVGVGLRIGVSRRILGRATAELTVERAIRSFDQDEVGDWVAILECGHRQHVRHRPPWQERAWVLTPEGRQDRIGTILECRICDEESAEHEPGGDPACWAGQVCTVCGGLDRHQPGCGAAPPE